MTRFAHDQFAKEYLEELLAPLGEVKAPRRVAGEVREIDVWFAPNTLTNLPPKALGLLGRLATTPALFEPFRNAATIIDIYNCLLKLLIVWGEFQREANRNKQQLLQESLPRLWILSPTASPSLLKGFGAKIDLDDWGEGIYFLPEYFRTAIVAIHKLPRTKDTLWIRLLGKGRVQEKAIDEIKALPITNPIRLNALKLLTNLKANLQATKQLDDDEENLIMKLSPLYLQWREEALREGEQQGIQQGIQQGMQQAMRLMIESMLEVKFGEIDGELSQIVEPLSQLPTKESTQLIWQLSREGLLAQFGEQKEI
ncbi:MAG: hypothetical protein F6K47_07430 [Symploca sp. SIO2E6]|nr:hypothetical protein [Symploca sp. SIO2E6]